MSFPVYGRDSGNTLLNWAPKITAIKKTLANFLSPLEWGEYTPVMAPLLASMTVPNLYVSSGNYFRLHKTVFFTATIQNTFGGVASAAINISLPVTPKATDLNRAHIAVGRIVDNVTTYMAQGFIAFGPNVQVARYDSSARALGVTCTTYINGFYMVD